MKWWNRLLDWLRSLFWKQEMELTLVGLHNAGKTTLVDVLSTGKFADDRIPTVGFNMRKVTKGAVVIKLWDIGGQPRFRPLWERYCRGVTAIVFVVDSAESDEQIHAARKELHDLLSRRTLESIPLLVLANKKDLPTHRDEKEMEDLMSLREINGREVACYSISAKNQVNIDKTLDWLIRHAKKRR